jgi:simple sugar transport system permease protein
MIVMAISGGVAALAGAGELAGLYHRVRMVDITVGYGYTGIIVAMLASLNPIGVILAAILFGGLVNGSMRLQVLTGVPISVVYAMQAIFLLCALTAEVISRYQIRRTSHE